MSGVDRASFMARVSAALGRKGVAPPAGAAPAVDPAIVRVTGEGPDVAGVFAARAAETGMVVHRADRATVGDRVCELVAGVGAKRAAVAGGLADVAGALRGRGVKVLLWPDSAGLEELYEVDVGITDVQGAIAESGTLVCWSGAQRGRGVSLVPPVHIALVRRSDIVPDMIDYLARHRAGGALASSVVFITGPSKTADIEGVLITGVHGPREVHIVLVEDA